MTSIDVIQGDEPAELSVDETSCEDFGSGGEEGGEEEAPAPDEGDEDAFPPADEEEAAGTHY